MMDVWYVVERGRFSFNMYRIKLIQIVSQWDYLVGQHGVVSSFTTIQGEKHMLQQSQKSISARCNMAAPTLA
jgi:hypothetical protein